MFFTSQNEGRNVFRHEQLLLLREI